MSDIKELRSRIKSIKSTRKITKAMQMVSASRLKRARKSLEDAQYYYKAIEKSARKLMGCDVDLSEFAKRILFGDFDTSKPKLIVAFAGDRGLCGSFNLSITKQMKEKIFSQGDFLLIAIGKRMMDFAHAHCPDSILLEYYGTEMDDKVLSEIKSTIVQRISQGSISSCHLYFNEFQNVITQKPRDKKIIPLEMNLEVLEETIPDIEGDNILDSLLELYILAEIKNAYVNSVASEEAARTTAMDNATRNAGDLIDKLTLVMNRKRQAVITKELIEIISGADAV